MGLTTGHSLLDLETPFVLKFGSTGQIYNFNVIFAFLFRFVMLYGFQFGAKASLNFPLWQRGIRLSRLQIAGKRAGAALAAGRLEKPWP